MGTLALLGALLSFNIYLKIDYTYYNLLFTILLIVGSFLTYRKLKPTFEFQLCPRSFLLFLTGLNLIAATISDRLILKWICERSEVSWGEKITWNDFHGPAEWDTEYAAAISSRYMYKINKVYNYPQVIGLTMMDPEASWFKPDICDKDVLAHEQLHFDLSEVYTRKLTDSLAFNWARPIEEAEGIVEHFTKALDEAQAQYDSISNHSINLPGQLYYKKLIGSQLKTLNSD